MQPNRLIKLLASNRAVKDRAFSARVLDKKGDDATTEAEVLLYDVIVDTEVETEWWGGVAADAFVKAVRALDVDVIHVRINSPGGSVFAGRSMETALREHRARIVVHVDGLAASAASLIAMAGDHRVMSKGAMMMIHKAWTIAVGNGDDFAKAADLLNKLDGTLAQTYADRSGGNVDDIMKAMADETWYTADEAVDAGLADEVAPSEGKAAAAWNLAAFDRAPTTAEPEPEPDPNPEPNPSNTLVNEGDDGQNRRRWQRVRAALLTAPLA